MKRRGKRRDENCKGGKVGLTVRWYLGRKRAQGRRDLRLGLYYSYRVRELKSVLLSWQPAQRDSCRRDNNNSKGTFQWNHSDSLRMERTPLNSFWLAHLKSRNAHFPLHLLYTQLTLPLKAVLFHFKLSLLNKNHFLRMPERGKFRLKGDSTLRLPPTLTL